MDQSWNSDYYIQRRQELLQDFDKSAWGWQGVLSQPYDRDLVEAILKTSRQQFIFLLPHIPYIVGDDNHQTGSLLGSVECLAFYFGIKAQGKGTAETGKVLYDAVLARGVVPVQQPSHSNQPSREERMEIRRRRAERSQRREYEKDWVYEFVEGEGEAFDYGYNFTECATQKFYRLQAAEEFLPFYCFLDFPKCEVGGLGLARTKTLAEGDDHCDFRFMEGGTATQHWPLPFMKS